MAKAVPPFLLTKEQLRSALQLDSARMVDELMRRRKIPFLKLGHRTVRFDLERVLAALEKLEVHEVGRTRHHESIAKTSFSRATAIGAGDAVSQPSRA